MFAASPNLANRLKRNHGSKQMAGQETRLCQRCRGPELLFACAVPSPGFGGAGGCLSPPIISSTFIRPVPHRKPFPESAAVPGWLAPGPNNPAINASVA